MAAKNSNVACPKCKGDIPNNAEKCKHCGSSTSGNWFSRHKIATAIIIVIVLAIASKDQLQKQKDLEEDKKPETNIINVVPETTEPETTPETTKKPEVVNTTSKITKENCDLITAGMSGEEVKAILGEPSSKSQSEIEGLGTSDYWMFQEGLNFKSCAVSLTNNSVTSKTWTEF